MNLAPSDWIITGTPYKGGVRVIASKTLKPGGSITIVQHEEDVDTFVPGLGRITATSYSHDHYRIVALAEDLVIADGPDYPSALRFLFAIWQVPDAPAPVSEIFDPGHLRPEVVLTEEIGYHRLAALAALEEAVQPMSDEERALYERMLGEEP